MLDLPKFDLYLIRHGESEVNVQPDLMGQTADVELTSNGKNQAKLLGKRLKQIGDFDFVFASPYIRAADTAKIALPNASIVFDKDLREYDAGDWTLSSRSEVMTDKIMLRMNYLNMSFQPPHGESQYMVERRASEWLEKEILYFEYNGKNINQAIDKDHVKIAVFSHGMTIKCILHYVMGFDRTFVWKIEIDNTSITKLSFGDKGWRLNFVNDTSHLR